MKAWLWQHRDALATTVTRLARTPVATLLNLGVIGVALALPVGLYVGLDNLTAVVDRNRLQQGARTEDTNRLDSLPDRWSAFGWDVVEVDGHDHLALRGVLEASAPGRPTCVIANTVKGKGVSFMEDRVEWHHKIPTAEQVAAAHLELAR